MATVAARTGAPVTWPRLVQGALLLLVPALASTHVLVERLYAEILGQHLVTASQPMPEINKDVIQWSDSSLHSPLLL